MQDFMTWGDVAKLLVLIVGGGLLLLAAVWVMLKFAVWDFLNDWSQQENAKTIERRSTALTQPVRPEQPGSGDSLDNAGTA